jgi:hypothetical protein
MRKSFTFSAVTALFVVLVAQSAVLANGGTLLPLDQYQAGTETTTLVPNGDFENTVAGVPVGWTPVGTFQSAAPVGANTSPAINGNYAAQGPLGGPLQRNGYQQVVSVLPNTNYQLSGYAWNFSPSQYDLVLVEMTDSLNPTLKRNFSLAALDVDPADGTTLINGARGVFGHKLFNSSTYFPSGSAILEVSFEYDASVPFPAGRPPVSGQIDNVALTPADTFVAPARIPEPATASLLALAAAGMLARRRTR